MTNFRFIGVELIPFMQTVVQEHTKHYQSDFEIDKETLTEAVGKNNFLDKTFIWLCRENGTWLLRERDVFIKNTRENNTFRFYKEQTREKILAFTVEISGYSVINGSLIGNIYPRSYDKLYELVKSVSVPASSVLMKYQLGTLIKSADDFNGYPDSEYGYLTSYEFFPQSEDALKKILRDERAKRLKFTVGNTDDYLSAL